MSTDLLYFAADVVALVGRLSWWLLIGTLWALLVLAAVSLYLPERWHGGHR